MALLPIYNTKKEQVGEVNLAESLLSEPVKKAVVYYAVRRILASKHHGTVDTKTRAEVHRTTRKIYRQKGTGNARHGSRKSSPFVGGGRVFGPHPRDFSIAMPKKARRLAMREVLRDVIMEGKITLVDRLNVESGKTKEASHMFAALGLDAGLIVIEAALPLVERAIRNLKRFKVLKVNQLNVVDLLKYPRLMMTVAAFDRVRECYLKEEKGVA